MRETYLRVLDRLNVLCYWAGVGDVLGSEGAWLELVARGEGAPSASVDFELTGNGARMVTEPWQASAIQVTYRGERLGRLPLRYGGFPWDPDLFATRAASLLAVAALAVDLEMGGQR
jgi:hypothetical protein